MKKSDWKKIPGLLLFLVTLASVSWFICYKTSLLQEINFSSLTAFTTIFYIGLTISVLLTSYMLSQAVLACFYKPVTEWNSDRPLPGCTVIVPAYNEGSAVADTLRSLLKSDYPADKLEIIAVNDGSKDDTLNWIKLV